jgi:WD40 repeat protein
VKIKKTKDWGIPGIAFDVARHPESGRLFYGSSDFKVYEFDPAAEKPEPAALHGAGHSSYVTSVAPVGNQLVSGSYDGQLVWWDLVERRQIRAQAAHAKWIRNIAVSTNGKRLASVGDDMVCNVWDAETGELKNSFADHAPMTPNHYPSMLFAVTISADDKLLATADKIGHIIVRDLESGKTLAELDAPGMYTWDPTARRHSIGGIRSLAFSADGTQIAAGGIGKIGNIDHLGGPSRVEVFNWKDGSRLHLLEDDKLKGLVERLEFHADGQTLLTAGGDHSGFVTLYDLGSGKVAHQEKAPMHVHGHTMDADWKSIYTVGHGRIAQWTAES